MKYLSRIKLKENNNDWIAGNKINVLNKN